MWTPTHVCVTVQRAVGLLIKGKHETNNCFVTISLGKMKFETSIIEKSDCDVEWHEECELSIPSSHGNKAEIVLVALHRNTLGFDEFLGRVAISLNALDIYEKPRNKWYTLESKPGKSDKRKERGQIEVKIEFTVRSGSLTNLNKKAKQTLSIDHLSHAAQSIGGSLLSLTSSEKRKNVKKIVKSLGSKINVKTKHKHSIPEDTISELPLHTDNNKSNVDPGVLSDDDEFTFDDLSSKSSRSSLYKLPSTQSLQIDDGALDTVQLRPKNEVKHPDGDGQLTTEKPIKNIAKQSLGEIINRTFERRQISQIKGNLNYKECNDNKLLNGDNKIQQKTGKSNYDRFISHSNERIIIGGETEANNITSCKEITNDELRKYEEYSREELVLLISKLQKDVNLQKKRNKDLEDYIDDLLLRVMVTTPKLLQTPYVNIQ